MFSYMCVAKNIPQLARTVLNVDVVRNRCSFYLENLVRNVTSRCLELDESFSGIIHKLALR